jgi:hypothetical protein
MRRLAARLAAALLLLASTSCLAGLPQLCNREHEPSAEEQDVLLRFSALVKNELAAAGTEVALVARSGLDLHRLDVRYSHAGVVLKDAELPWTVRQLYFACEERRPRVFDQGMAGFLLGGDDPGTGWVSLVLLPPDRAAPLARAALDRRQALRVLGSTYSANAYPFSTRYQNCNQWVMELLASAWDPEASPEDPDPRFRAQRWLYAQRYAPTEFELGAHPMTWLAEIVPWLHADDHPPWQLAANRFAVSMPLSIETFVHRVVPEARRIELCHVGRRVVIHHGWDAIPDGCLARDGDRQLDLERG